MSLITSASGVDLSALPLYLFVLCLQVMLFGVIHFWVWTFVLETAFSAYLWSADAFLQNDRFVLTSGKTIEWHHKQWILIFEANSDVFCFDTENFLITSSLLFFAIKTTSVLFLFSCQLPSLLLHIWTWSFASRFFLYGNLRKFTSLTGSEIWC